MTMTMTVPELTDHDEAISIALATRDFLLAHPEHHHQSTWQADAACGTVACVGGWVGILHDDPYSSVQLIESLPTVPTRKKKQVKARWQARQAARLGLDTCAADILFTGSRSDAVALEMLTGIALWHRDNPDRVEPMLYDEMAAIRDRAIKIVGKADDA